MTLCPLCKKDIPDGEKAWISNHLSENPDCPDYVLCDVCYLKGEEDERR